MNERDYHEGKYQERFIGSAAAGQMRTTSSAELPRLLETVSGSVGDLERRAEVLLNRLRPVSRSVGERPVEDVPRHPTCTDAGSALEEINHRINRFIITLDAILDAVEV